MRTCAATAWRGKDCTRQPSRWGRRAAHRRGTPSLRAACGPAGHRASLQIWCGVRTVGCRPRCRCVHARAHACTSPRPAACRRSHPAARLCAHSPDPTRLTLLAPQDGSVNELDDALLEAVADGDSEATAALLAAGANVNHLSVQHDWASPAILATQEGSLDCLHLLLAVRSDGGGALLAEVDRADPSPSPP